MPLAQSILDRIRDEIGADTDFSDAVLETIYEDTDRGNFSVLNTALIVWRRRLHNLQARSFDVSTEGSLLSRHQRIRFIERRIKELEMDADATRKGANWSINSAQQQEEAASSGEY